MITNDQKDLIVTMKNDNEKITHIAVKLGISRDSVYKVLRSGWTVEEQFLDSYKKVKEEKHNQLLNLISSDPITNSIASKILQEFDKDVNIKAEIAKNGLRGLATVFGVIYDKTIKVAELRLKQQAQAFAKEIKETYKPENDNFKVAASEALIKLAESGNFMDFIEKDSMIDQENVS